jgi:hypothetical protein
MFFYVILEAVAAVAIAILLSVRTKKSEGVVYGTLDKVGTVTNIVLSFAYAFAAPFCMFIGMISAPAHDGLLGIVGWLAAIIMASAPLFCGLGIGYSVALRRKGKSKLSFAVQFAGIVGIALTVDMYALFAGNLLKTMN